MRLINGFEAGGEVRLIGAHIDGSLDMSGARIRRPDGVAPDLADVVLGGSPFLIGDAAHRKPVVEGRIDMGAARIAGQMIVRDAELGGTAPLTGPYASSRSGGTAISAPRAAVNEDLSIEGACHVRGGDARGARDTDRQQQHQRMPQRHPAGARGFAPPAGVYGCHFAG